MRDFTLGTIHDANRDFNCQSHKTNRAIIPDETDKTKLRFWQTISQTKQDLLLDKLINQNATSHKRYSTMQF